MYVQVHRALCIFISNMLCVYSYPSCCVYISIDRVIYFHIHICIHTFVRAWESYTQPSCHLTSYSYMNTHLCAGVRNLHTNYYMHHVYSCAYMNTHLCADGLRAHNYLVVSGWTTHAHIYMYHVYSHVHMNALSCAAGLRAHNYLHIWCIRAKPSPIYLHISCIFTRIYECTSLCGRSESTNLFTYIMYQSETLTHLSTNIMHIQMYTRIHTFVHAVWEQETIHIYYVPGWNPTHVYIDLYIHMYIHIHTFVHAVWAQELTHDICNSCVYTNAHRVHKSVHSYIYMNVHTIYIYRVSDWNPLTRIYIYHAYSRVYMNAPLCGRSESRSRAPTREPQDEMRAGVDR